MIDVKKTILETIKDKINKMRFKAINDPKGLKKILSLIVLDDLYEWSDYLDAPQQVQAKLKDLMTDYILCQRDFKIEHTPQEGFYINVNTPQTNYTWKRVWDAPGDELIILGEEIKNNEYIYLTNLTETRTINGANYIYVNDISFDNTNHAKILETFVDENKYIKE